MISGAPDLSAPVAFTLTAVSAFKSAAPALSAPVVFTLTAEGVAGGAAPPEAWTDAPLSSAPSPMRRSLTRMMRLGRL